MKPTQPYVVIVGAGPTGLMTANLLGRADVPVLVIERDAVVSDQPRAVSIDDEAMRTLQAAGLYKAAQQITVEGTGTQYYGQDGDSLAYARGAFPPRLGHSVKNPLDQPEFDRMLLAGLARYPSVQVVFGTSLTGVRQTNGGVQLNVTDSLGDVRNWDTDYLLGCDGGRSSVRALLGIEMTGQTFPDPWIVIDAVEDPHDQRYAMHHGDPRRPHVIIPGRNGRCRYEFMLLPGEDPDAAVTMESVAKLLEPYRQVDSAQIVRRAVYQFHALIAETWQVDRIFLLGDAAHMMPPFAGQGLNSGLRDACNIGWKLGALWRGQAGPHILDSYEVERRPHAEAMVQLSQRMGSIMMTTSATRARVRDLTMSLVAATSFGRRYLRELRFKPKAVIGAGILIDKDTNDGLIGHMLPQPAVLEQNGGRVLLDAALGDGFALLVVDPAPTDPMPDDELWADLAATVVRIRLDDRLPVRAREGVSIADADGVLTELLRTQVGNVLVIRPDRYVAAVFDAETEAYVAQHLRRLLGTPFKSTTSHTERASMKPRDELDQTDQGAQPKLEAR
jgi:3-(3-hydroxy-phenyl)propionate hydroxylase